MNNKTCQHHTINASTLMKFACVRKEGHEGVHTGIDGYAWSNEMHDFKQAMLSELKRIDGKATWTCAQCGLTMDPILEFVHECYEPWIGTPARPAPGQSQITRTYCETCKHDYRTRDAYLAQAHAHEPSAFLNDAPLVFGNPILITTTETETKPFTIQTADGPQGIYCETIETSHSEILSCLIKDEVVAQFRNWTSWSKDK